VRRFFLRILNAFRPAAAESDLSRELESHLAQLEDEYRRRGLTADAARRAARLTLGGVEQTKELHRNARSFVWIDETRRELRYGARTLRRYPIFAPEGLRYEPPPNHSIPART